VFLLPNIIYLLQPLDQGVLKYFSSWHYWGWSIHGCHWLLKEYITAFSRRIGTVSNEHILAKFCEADIEKLEMVPHGLCWGGQDNDASI
jgi:hypothetical protein